MWVGVGCLMGSLVGGLVGAASYIAPERLMTAVSLSPFAFEPMRVAFIARAAQEAHKLSRLKLKLLRFIRHVRGAIGRRAYHVRRKQADEGAIRRVESDVGTVGVARIDLEPLRAPFRRV